MERALERLRREQRIPRSLTLRELVEEYLAQHEAEPETIEKLRWLLAKSVAVFGDLRIDELRSQEIANWRMTISSEQEAAVRVVGRARGRRDALGPQTGPMVVFAAATGLRPGEWIALERRDVDLSEGVIYVRRAYRNGRLKYPKTEASMPSVPLQDVALAALERVPMHKHTPLLFPAANGGYFDLHNLRNREWKPAQQAAGITPPRRIYDLRHTFATVALRAGISTFALSRYMGASLTMIDRRYGHLTSDGVDHARRLLDIYSTAQKPPWTLVDARWTSQQPELVTNDNAKPE